MKRNNKPELNCPYIRKDLKCNIIKRKCSKYPSCEIKLKVRNKTGKKSLLFVMEK